MSDHEELIEEAMTFDWGGEQFRYVMAGKLIAALEAGTAPTENEREATCDGGCDYNSGPEEDCSLHGRPVAEVWGIVYKLSAELKELRAEAVPVEPESEGEKL